VLGFKFIEVYILFIVTTYVSCGIVCAIIKRRLGAWVGVFNTPQEKKTPLG
jgi:hypothetical protein